MDSYVRGPAAALLNQTIDETVRQTAHRFPDREALVACHENQRFTWAQLSDAVERTARGLIGLGLQPGGRVGIWASNCSEWLLLQYAASRAGVILVNINPAYRAHELRYVLRKSRIQALFLREADERSCYREILAEALHGQSLSLTSVVFLKTPDWFEFLAGGIEIPGLHQTADDVANIQYTSGTTGNPKGVLLTHRNVVNNGLFIGRWLHANEGDTICIPVPLYHCFGCVIGSMVAITSGAKMVLPGDRFHALPTMRAIESERCTLAYGVPTMFIAIINHGEFKTHDFSSLRGGIMAGSPCPVEIMKRVMTEMHCPGLTIVYGQTESSPVITGSTTDDTIEHRAFTVGRVFPQTEIKLVSRENGATIGRGDIGEICTRGYVVMKGYDGYLHLTGRAKDMIIRGGENVYPKEVESSIHEHPKVANVEVVGVPDMRLGEAVAAWVILRPGESATVEDIRAFCESNMAHFKVPQYIRFVDSFPTTVTGKTQKYLIREREIELLGLKEAALAVTA